MPSAAFHYSRILIPLAALAGCSRAAGVPIFVPAPNPIPLEVAADPQNRSHPLVHPLLADSSAADSTDPLRLPADEILTVDVHKGDINALAVAPGGERAYSGGNDGQVVQTVLIPGPSGIGAVETSTLLSGSKPIQALALDPAGKVLAISQYGAVMVYDFATREIVARLTRLDGRVTALAWDSRGELLALGRADGGLFVWNVFKGDRAGEDTLDAVEQYNGGTSPIERIIFHPAARIFFALEKKGMVGIWRLARTEYEMGLRDNDVNPTQPQLGIRRWTFIQLPSPIEDFGITESGRFLHLILADGKAILWKVRGLKPVATLGATEVNSYQLSEINAGSESAPLHLFATTGRTETLSLWCQNRPTASDAKITVPGDNDKLTTVTADDDDESESGGIGAAADDPTTVNLLNEFTDVSGGIQAIEPVSSDPSAMSPFLKSAQLKHPLKAIEAPPSGGQLLWASQKTGNLLVFKLNSLGASQLRERYQQQCKD